MTDSQTFLLPQTLPALLRQRAEAHGDALFIQLAEDRGGEIPLSSRAVWELAQETAASLQAHGLKSGDRVMLGLPTGIDFLRLFFGISLAGAVPVPFYPPARTKGVEDYENHLAALIGKAEPRLVFAMDRARLVTESAAMKAGSRAQVLTPDALKPGGVYVAPAEDPQALALIQFTSGSTRAPRGVMLTHQALLANTAAFLEAIEIGPEDRTVSWLPLYHDMGLIGTVLMCLSAGIPIFLMSPQVFLLDVKRWLWAMHRFRATITVAPNFAYQLVLNRVSDAQLEGLDLSRWRLAACGAEPILPATLEAFGKRLEPYGFDPRALTPVYGMAEVAVAASAPPMWRGMRVDTISGDMLEASGKAAPVEPRGREAHVVSVGSPLPGYRMRIASPEGQALPERETGEIQIQGPSVMAGYLGDAEATEAAFVDGWLRTGDLGYMVEGELYIVGRIKDLILKGGRNYAPQDFEALASEVDGVRQGCVAAFGASDPETGTERIVILAETRESEDAHAAIARAIASRISQALGVQPDEVHLVEPGVLPKTSSGKIQRDKARQNWLKGGLKAPVEPGLLAKTRIVGRAMAQRAVAQMGAVHLGRDKTDA